MIIKLTDLKQQTKDECEIWLNSIYDDTVNVYLNKDSKLVFTITSQDCKNKQKRGHLLLATADNKNNIVLVESLDAKLKVFCKRHNIDFKIEYDDVNRVASFDFETASVITIEQLYRNFAELKLTLSRNDIKSAYHQIRVLNCNIDETLKQIDSEDIKYCDEDIDKFLYYQDLLRNEEEFYRDIIINKK